jgi:O-antigen/teichoic acid export membrane protein
MAPLSYAIRIILSRDLGGAQENIHDFGLFYGIISLLTLLSAMNDLGATESLNYFLPKYLIKKEYGRVKYLLRLVLFLQLGSSFLIM